MHTHLSMYLVPLQIYHENATILLCRLELYLVQYHHEYVGSQSSSQI